MRLTIPDDQQVNPVAYLAQHCSPEIIQAGSAFSQAVYQHSTLSLREFEAARMRTALINGCAACRGLRAERDLAGFMESVGGNVGQSVLANGPAPDEAFYQSVANWAEASCFSERERLAIEYAEGMGERPQEVARDEDFWNRFKAVYSEQEIVDLTYSIASWIAMGRAIHVLGLDGSCPL